MRLAYLAGAVIATPIALFFTFYTVRLYSVTRFFTLAPPNSGAYIGAVAFPAIAIGMGFVARWSWRRGKAPPR